MSEPAGREFPSRDVLAEVIAQLKGALFLVSDEHGVVPATEADAAESDAATVAFFVEGYEKLRARRS